MPRIIIIIAFFISTVSWSQTEKIISTRIISQTVDTKYNGSFTFKANLVLNTDLFQGINIMAGLKDFQLIEYSFKNKLATNLPHQNFPIPIQTPQVDLITTLRFTNGQESVDIRKIFKSVDNRSWGGLDRNWLDTEDRDKIYKTFSIHQDNQELFYKLKIEIINPEIKISFYSGRISETLEPIKKRLTN
ncbi:hypothetical protein LY01_01647 [Nonlabens xylanidelens]|uniref:Uncharacterized protein n=1 Tax=Nonlabens xylanidelens TaxID=191564 RepID=A0A2S6IKY1_9FLAO|nr:hypothetical protein [Nonlabens xylanidelens]PPK94894.1 hypothetical protein LY01_01647 [Nonlabens xylanidelens]PQJ17442.1 hypothetical protein BST94_10305 [Nonlabens xylanidelens]